MISGTWPGQGTVPDKPANPLFVSSGLTPGPLPQGNSPNTHVATASRRPSTARLGDCHLESSEQLSTGWLEGTTPYHRDAGWLGGFVMVSSVGLTSARASGAKRSRTAGASKMRIPLLSMFRRLSISAPARWLIAEQAATSDRSMSRAAEPTVTRGTPGRTLRRRSSAGWLRIVPGLPAIPPPGCRFARGMGRLSLAEVARFPG